MGRDESGALVMRINTTNNSAFLGVCSPLNLSGELFRFHS